MNDPVPEHPAIHGKSYDYIASYIRSCIQQLVNESGNNNVFLV